MSQGQVQGLAKGDFNGDGKLDMAVTYDTNYNARTSVGILTGNGDGTFQPVVNLPLPSSFGANQQLYGILAKDFNNDGKLDLIVSAYDTKSLLYYQGKGDGTFNAPTLIFTGLSGDQVQAADLNGDGKLDLVVVRTYDGVLQPANVSILLNLGGGNFSAPQLVSNGSNDADAFALGNVDGKNGPDIITASFGDSKIVVLLNDGTGHFGPTVTTPTGGVFIHSIVAADFLGNGTTQLLAGSANTPAGTLFGGSSIGLLKSNGDGTFQLTPDEFIPDDDRPGLFYSDNTAPDLNGDGRPDFVMGHYDSRGTNIVTVGLNQGNGTFAISRFVASPGQSIPNPGVPAGDQNSPAIVVAGDFHGTGVPDLAVGAFSDLFGAPAGLSLLPAVPSSPGTYLSPRAFVSLPQFIDGPATSATGARSQALGAFGPGGTPALVSLTAGTYAGIRYLNKGAVLQSAPVNANGTLGAAITTLAFPTGNWGFNGPLVPADFNGDGRTDLAFFGTTGTDYVLIAQNQGDGTFSAFGVPLSINGRGPKGLAIGDLNGDGKLDFAVVSTTLSGTGTDYAYVDVYLNTGLNSFTHGATLPLGFSSNYAVAIGDFNGDGKADIVADHSSAVLSQGDVQLFKGNGDGTFAAPVVIGPAPGTDQAANQFVGVDLRHNGRLDLVGIGGNLYVYLNNGDGTFQIPVEYGAGGLPNDFKVADLNADGKLDVAVTSNFGGLAVVTGNGDGTFNLPQFFASGSSSIQGVNVGDLNGDGRPDLVVQRTRAANAGDQATVMLAITPAPPTLDPIGDQSVAQDSGAHVVNLTGISVGTGNTGQTLTVSATSDNPSLIPNPTLSYVSANSAGTLTFTSTAGQSGTANITVRVSETNQTAVATQTFKITVTSAAATVTASGVGWGTQTLALQTAADGLRLFPAGRVNDLPWANVSRFQVTLSRSVSLSPSDVTARGVKIADYGPVTISGTGPVYTITLAMPVTDADRVTVTIGNANLATYTRRLDILPGDVNDDGVVNAADLVAVRNQALNLGTVLIPAIFCDLNGDGTVDMNDLLTVRRKVGKRLP